ncbi:MAG: CpaF family protein [Marivibrio sp.]|uniref:CpaF family protein n=1 Tax=Marivibrio sp. TaxID=2039719 RepID=UPI0032EC599A
MALVSDIANRVNRKDREDDPRDPAALRQRLQEGVDAALSAEPEAGRGRQAEIVRSLCADFLAREQLTLNPLQQRDLVTQLLNAHLAAGRAAPAGEASPSAHSTAPSRPPPARTLDELTDRREPERGADDDRDKRPREGRASSRASVEQAAESLRPVLMDQIDATAAAKLDRPELVAEVEALLPELMRDLSLRLNSLEQRDLVTILVNDMLGLGPLESLLADESVTDILVNGPAQVYVERAGKLVLTDVVFRDAKHLMAIATRIVTRIGRRVDESSPMCDARLEDGSRVNIIIPPLAIDGASISIRKFSEKKITLEVMTRQGNISPAMERVLQIAARARLNILISGGTGSGKTTLLNALSRMIDTTERIVTIEDAAELQLQQPHVVRLETRPPNLEGEGEVTMRGLVKNSLRMRPDRIILGEVRGSEAVDMLQAMNTGHDGSMCTVHANNPREALTRLENMVGMAGINLPAKAVRTQIASAIDLIVQVSRMRDGVRRITSVTEVVGMEGDIVTTQELFRFRYEGEDRNGKLIGTFEPAGVRPHFSEKAAYFGLEKPLLDAVG